MALTQNNFSGAETGGNEELEAVSGGFIATAVRRRTGTYSYHTVNNMVSTGEFLIASGGSTNAGNNHIVGFGYRPQPVVASNTTEVFSDGDGSGNKSIRLKVDSSGNLLLFDASDSQIGSASSAIADGVFHFIEVYWENANSAVAEIFVNNISVIGPLSTEDLLNTGVVDRYILGADVATVSRDHFFDDFYCLTGATAATDRLGDSEIYKYQSVKDSITPDDGGGDLDAGTWHRAGETPLADTATNPEYTDAGAGAVDTNNTNGSPEGPNNDVRIDGDSNIKALKGVWNMQRSGGGGSDHFGLLGNSVDGAARSADLDPTAAFANYFLITVANGGAAGDIPLSTEYCRIGFETTGAQDFECKEMWAMLLHVPVSGVTMPIFDHHYRAMRGR